MRFYQTYTVIDKIPPKLQTVDLIMYLRIQIFRKFATQFDMEIILGKNAFLESYRV
jgi:hypothetical protein